MDTEALVNSSLVTLDTPSFTDHNITDISSLSQLTVRSKTAVADPGLTSNRYLDYKAHYDVEKLLPKMGHAKLPSPRSVGDEHDFRQDGQGHQEMDSERSVTTHCMVIYTATAGALSRGTPRDVPRAHTSGGSWPPVRIAGTTPIGAPLSLLSDLGTTNSPLWSEPSQPAKRDHPQFTESRPLLL